MAKNMDEQLNKLKTLLLEMANLTEEAIYKSIEALKDNNAQLALRVVEEDKQIDRLELIIDEMAIDLIALRQPVATDLRLIIGVMKINAELERIADLSTNISHRVIELGDKPLLEPMVKITELSQITRKMVKDAIDAFVHQDKKLAKEVILSDPKVNQLKNDIQHQLVYDYMVKDGACAPQAVPLVLTVRHLERISDHATNIAEDIIYILQSLCVRHQ
ncbi:MAG: phosphate signaling complex protein PhoU [bacterium]